MESQNQIPSIFICPNCSKQFMSANAFLTHVARKYGISSEQMFCKINNIQNIPLCQCGCGAEMVYQNFKLGYAKWKRGHVSAFSNSAGEEAKKRAQKAKITLRANIESGATVIKRKKKEK